MTVGIMGAALVMTSAAEARKPPPVRCGDTITHNTKLKRSLAGCSGYGLIVKGRHITLDLNNLTVRGDNVAAEQVGILLDNARDVTVKNGTVRGFDAGIDIEGGSNNTVKSIVARNNVNDNVAPADPKNPTPEEECNFGDGITVTGSRGNDIVRNHVLDNGPFSCISIVEDSDGNTVAHNVVANNNVPNEDAAPGIQGDGFCGSPFSRPVQDIGIRVEGPGANDNEVTDNKITNSAIGGITIHGYVFNPVMGPPQDPNTDNVVSKNYVADTGKETSTTDPVADGISVLSQGPTSRVAVSQDNSIVGNTIVGSLRHGINLGGKPPQPVPPLDGNTVARNDVRTSAVNGINVALGSINNTLNRNFAADSGGSDGFDANPGCDNNLWTDNEFDFVNMSCVEGPPAEVRPPAPAPARSAPMPAR
ncbi:MAG: NosD domain-containing protein [Solirubrobacteraceae bacterium]